MKRSGTLLAAAVCMTAACDGQGDNAVNTSLAPFDGGPLDPPVVSDGGPIGGNIREDAATAKSPTDPPDPPVTGKCDISLGEVAIYQGVKISLRNADGSLAMATNADVIQQRPAFIRAFVVPGPTWSSNREAMLRLILRSSSGATAYFDRKVVDRVSADSDLNSTFNFEVPASEIEASAAYSIDIVGPTSCVDKPNETRFPASGDVTLWARNTGKMKVRLVPVRYDADGSGRMPDLSDSQLKKYRDYLFNAFPVQAIDLSIRDTVGTSDPLTAGGGWSELLEGIKALRSRDAVAADVYYYGLVAPAETFSIFCKGSCVGGISYQAGANGAQFRAGVGLGFSDWRTVEAMAHELGHQHGRAHAPCDTTVSVDPDYPYKAGGIGSWGYDLRTKVLYNPGTRKDMMGYCTPRWISDYTFKALTERSVIINNAPVQQALVIGDVNRDGRVVMVDARGAARWGLPPADNESPSGARESADVLDAAGARIATVDVYRTALSEDQGSVVLVPGPTSGAHSIAVAGSPPLAYDAPAAVSPLTP